MFDSVSRSVYEAEREARIRAEAIAEELRESLKEERKRVTDLLKMLHPDAEKPPLITGGPQGFIPSEQLARMPAVGLRGLREKKRLVSEAKAREDEEEQKTDAEKRREALAPEEADLIDTVIAGR